jgi:hypothetical protein
MAKLKGY